MSNHHPHNKKHVLLLSLFRMVLALLSLSFFLYFFLSEVVEITANRKGESVFKHYEVPYRVFVGALVDEQSLLVHHLTGQEYRYPEALNKTDSLLPTIKAVIQSSSNPTKTTLLTKLDDLYQIRQKVFSGSFGIIAVLDHYEALIADICFVWISQINGPIEAIYNNVMQDIYHDLIIHDLSTQRDLLLSLLLHNNTPSEYHTLKKYSLQYINLNPILRSNAILYGTKALDQYYYYNLSIPSILFNQMMTLTSLNYQQTQSYTGHNFSLPGYIHFDPLLFENSFYTILDAIDSIDSVELGDTKFPDLLARSLMAVLGLILQVVITGSLLWVSITLAISLRKSKSPDNQPPPSSSLSIARNVDM